MSRGSKCFVKLLNIAAVCRTHRMIDFEICSACEKSAVSCQRRQNCKVRMQSNNRAFPANTHAP